MWLTVRGAGIAGKLLQSPSMYALTFRRSLCDDLVCLFWLDDFICHGYYSLLYDVQFGYLAEMEAHDGQGDG